jgi:parallel beta-helix repeat protein
MHLQFNNQLPTPNPNHMRRKVECFRIFCYLLLLLFLFGAVSLRAQTIPTYYYVAPGGDDSNPGTELLPWKTLAKAASMATAGVTVFIRQGTYNEQLIPANSGTAEEPITFASYPGDTVTIDGTGMEPDNGSWYGLLYIDGLRYIKISGLRFINSVTAGIAVKYSSYITIEKNYIESTDNSGMDIHACENIVVEANEVLRGSIVADCECISIAQTNLFEIKNNRVHEGLRIGIDVKEGSSNGIVCNNELFNLNGANGIYIDAWASHEFNIDVFENIAHDNRIGIAVTCENGGLIENIRVHNNIAYNNDQRGFFVVGSGIAQTHPLRNIKVYGNRSFENGFGIEIGGYTGTTLDSIAVFNNLICHNKSAGIRITRYDGPSGEYVMRNVSVINNTIYGNGTVGNGWDAENFGMNIFNISPENMLIRNNIISNNAVGTIHVSPEVPADSVSIDYNFFDGFRNKPFETAGTNAFYDNPLFIDSLNNDFHLQDTSACIDKGNPDQQYNDPEDPNKPGYALYPALGTLRNDMGAYGGPFASSWDPASYALIPPAPILTFPFNSATGVPTTLLLGWNGPWGATSYHLQVSTSSEFSSLVIDTSNIVGSSFGIRNFDSNMQYYWRVKAINAAGTGFYSSTWNFTTKGPTSLEQFSSDIPIACALYQNYPNPFNSSTDIWFALPENKKVLIDVFDIYGKKIETLVDENLPPGYHKTVFEDNNYRDGVYICHIQSGNYKQVIKMVLIKK